MGPSPSGAARRCAVLGSPIRHSLSPVLHQAAYDELGLGWSYEACEVDVAGLPTFLDGLGPVWRGLSLTMPLKRAVLPLVDEIGESARRAGAANTVLLGEGRRVGHNTDVPGAVEAVRERWTGPLSRAVLLGGGATAASLVLALADLGCRSVTLLVRDDSRAAETVAVAARHPAGPEIEVRRIGGPAPAPAADIVVSTIPAAAQTADLLDVAGRAGVVFDVVYDPWPTPLAAQTIERGQVLVTGLDLLVHQAVLQVELMTGVAGAPLEVMRRAGETALTARSLS
jgi:shikimate dehydrogenase